MVQASVDSHVMLLGGVPLAREIIIWWNFVGTQRTQIDQAVADWNALSPRFGSIDTELKRLVAPVPPWSA